MMAAVLVLAEEYYLGIRETLLEQWASHIVVQQKIISIGINFSEEFSKHVILVGRGCPEKMDHFHHCIHHLSMLI